MTASRKDVDRWIWIEEAKARGASHIISVRDTLDYTDYPFYVKCKSALKERLKYYQMAEMQTINEVIDGWCARRRNCTKRSHV